MFIITFKHIFCFSKLFKRVCVLGRGLISFRASVTKDFYNYLLGFISDWSVFWLDQLLLFKQNNLLMSQQMGLSK